MVLLDTTKNTKNTNVTHYFPDLEKQIKS